MARMLDWFDTARVIVAYNGRGFDMEVLRRYYAGDEERWRAHARKLRDPMEAAQSVIGRRMRLSTLLVGRPDGVGYYSRLTRPYL